VLFLNSFHGQWMTLKTSTENIRAGYCGAIYSDL
jgi:hypothetical protein